MTFPFGPEGRERRSHSKSRSKSTSQAETIAHAKVESMKTQYAHRDESCSLWLGNGDMEE